jgi:lysophospholipase L1-like esterase
MILKNNISFLLVIILLGGCKTLGMNPFRKTQKNSFFNYHEKKFQCHHGSGIRDPDQFKLYKDKIWNPVRDSYNLDNKTKISSDIVIVGNSLIHIFEDRLLKQEFPNLNIVGRGIGGDTTELLRERFESNVLSLNPKTIIIEIGGNDLIYGKCLSTIQENISNIISDIQSYDPKIKIIILSLPPTLSTELNSIVPTYNLFLIKLAKSKNLEYIDLWNEMRDPDSPIIKQEYIRPFDTIHFNENGYRLIGRLLRPILNQK